MSTFTKLPNGTVIYTDNCEFKHLLQPSLQILSHPRDIDFILITDDVNPQETEKAFKIDWQDVTAPTATDRNDLIDKLANYFFFDNANIVWLINNTGAVSVKGTIVTASNVADNGFIVNPADVPAAIGIVAVSGIPDGEGCPVIISGKAQVLLQDNTIATRAYWVKVSDTQNGRANAVNQMPPGGTITALEDHMSEIGHCLQSVSAGIDKLAWIILHFN